MLVDAIGAPRTIELLARELLPVPDVIVEAARLAQPLFDVPVDSGKFFVAA
jgi:hypothetical protein